MAQSNNSEQGIMERDYNLVGKSFGSLTVLEPVGRKTQDRYIHWKCKCTCGNITTTNAQNLVSGKMKNCGPLHNKNVNTQASLQGSSVKSVNSQPVNTATTPRTTTQQGNNTATTPRTTTQQGNNTATTPRTTTQQGNNTATTPRTTTPMDIYLSSHSKAGNRASAVDSSMTNDINRANSIENSNYADRLENKTFGKLKVLQLIYKGDIGTFYKCRCECGRIFTTYHTALLAGLATSCGCEMQRDIIGKRIGKLEVLSIGVYCNCRCDCGKLTSVAFVKLTAGKVLSCGCTSYRNGIIGKHFGDLTVLENIRKDNNIPYSKCICTCGNRIDVQTNSLLLGNVRSCGCQQSKDKQFTGNVQQSKPLQTPQQQQVQSLQSLQSIRTDISDIDLIGKQFGQLKVIKRMGNFKNITYWGCVCSCGRTGNVATPALLNGYITSCSICKDNVVKDKAKRGMPKIDLSGNAYGALVALTYEGNSEWRCRCRCGNFILVKTTLLRQGQKLDCGCGAGKSKSLQGV